VILIAHSLGCMAVVHWAAQAPRALLQQVQGALLVAPADVERPNCPPALQNFAPIPRHLLPFPSQVVSSDNDAAISAPRAMELARDWGAEIGILTGAGHINVKSGHQRWEQGFAYLYRLQSRLEQGSLRRA
jgi:predicted alpha/beta hydrolase family esterase